MEEFKYQKELNLCVGSIREKLKSADIDRLDDINIEFKSGTTTLEYKREENTLYIDKDKLDKRNDKDNIIMRGLLNVISTDPNTKNSGISMNGKMDALNRGITNQLANALVPTEEENLQDFECNVITNLFTNIVGSDVAFDSYFNADGERVYQGLLNKLGNDANYLDSILLLSNTEVYEMPATSLLGDIQLSVSQKYLASNELTLNEIDTFLQNALFTDPEFAPEDGNERLTSCSSSDIYVKQAIYNKKQEQALNEMISGYSNQNKKGETYESGRVGHK